MIRIGYPSDVALPPPSAPRDLSATEQEWLEADEALWQRAHRIAGEDPTLDVGDVYHTLKNFQRTPEERLRRGLRHGRPRSPAL